MEQVLNAEQRNRAFTKFTVFFVLTIIVIIAAVFFNFRIPAEENERLRKQLEDYRGQEIEQQKIIATMDSTKILIDSLGRPGINNGYFAALISRELTNMTLQLNGNSIYGNANRTILSTFLNYNEAKTQLINLRDASQRIDELTRKLKQCEDDRDQAKLDAVLYYKRLQGS